MNGKFQIRKTFDIHCETKKINTKQTKWKLQEKEEEQENARNFFLPLEPNREQNKATHTTSSLTSSYIQPIVDVVWAMNIAISNMKWVRESSLKWIETSEKFFHLMR